jgi:hypothetical protein
MVEGIARAGVPWRTVLLEQLLELGLSRAERHGTVAVPLEAAQNVQKEKRLVRGALAASGPAPDLSDPLDPVHDRPV